MKKSIIGVMVIALITLVSTTATAQKFKPLDKSPMDQASYPSDYKIADKAVKVTYSRPQLKERPVDRLAPKGEVWRTGANEAAEITFYQDMMVGDTLVKKGTYTMYTIPGAKSWTTIISTDLNVWGSYFYDEANDVARVSSAVSQGKESLEAFSISFVQEKDFIVMYMGWGNVRTQTMMKPVVKNKMMKK